jgi:hypothetical protein
VYRMHMSGAGEFRQPGYLPERYCIAAEDAPN